MGPALLLCSETWSQRHHDFTDCLWRNSAEAALAAEQSTPAKLEEATPLAEPAKGLARVMRPEQGETIVEAKA
jgi:hypothetical protein